MIISTEDWPGSRQDLEAAIAVFQAQRAAHALTIGVAAPVPAIPVVGQIVAAGGSFILAHELDDSPAPRTRIEEIDIRLAAIDRLTLRPLRALALGIASQADNDRLTTLEAEASALRTERAALTSG
ncbi:hypothetical protein [Magnetospirillum sp. 64-120]|uniref:hypothetical protein n=1 Tax=Magnetospirillum sp. 64-120 TaxID=1895778 RepID=UPI0009268FED|nr:hypothetical protein [Magnetospirillum sp. 64-120]OJX79893.1 MAG: hypothetical protein BGO92_02980 [Magnetospirillum sp. 64-120]